MQYNTHYDITQDNLFQQMMVERNLKKGSIKAYRVALQKYCEYNQMTLTELYNEADNEEEEKIRAKNRTIIKRLRGFRTYLIQNDFATITITNYYASAKAFYYHYLIEVPYIPHVKLQRKQVMYEDIPQKKHIIKCLELTHNLKHKAIIYFMASSGTARQELCNLTIQDFIDATYRYHHMTSIPDALHYIETRDDIIPLFKMVRQKTGYKYYTCCTPEATKYLLNYLKTRNYKKLRPTQKLFDLTIDAVTIFFRRLNTKAGYAMTFLHPHSMRKYHADRINDVDLANILQGRKPNAIREAYFKQNPERILEEYKTHLQDLTLDNTDVNIVTIESEEVKKLKRLLKEERELNDKLQSKVSSIEYDVTLLNETLNELINNEKE